MIVLLLILILIAIVMPELIYLIIVLVVGLIKLAFLGGLILGAGVLLINVIGG